MVDTPDYNVTDQEVDDLLAKADSPQEKEQFYTDENESPVVEQKVEAPKVEAAPAAPVEPEYEFVHNGRNIKAPLSRILQYAQQGYDYPQRMAELNKQRESIQQMETTYKPIDEWVMANPDKWDKLQAVINAEQNGLGELPPQVLQTLQKYDQAFQRLEQERQQAQQKTEDDKLDGEVKSIREKYKDLDWAASDESGRNREQRVIDHAVKNGLPTFRAAFLDLHHDELLQLAETRAKESLVASKEKQAKSGLLTSTKAAPALKAPSNKSKHYESTESILAELGLPQ